MICNLIILNDIFLQRFLLAGENGWQSKWSLAISFLLNFLRTTHK